jgi:adenylate cyclase class 2
VVVDETPIGSFAEIEGPPRWIEKTARRLGVEPEKYITDNYATLFQLWKMKTGSSAQNMTFREVGRKRSARKR